MTADQSNLGDLVYAASKAAFSEASQKYSDQNFYSFGLFTDDSLQFVYPVANTEEGLTKTVERYKKEVDPKYGCTSTYAGMRWSYGDWEFFPDIGGNHFTKINEIVRANFDLPREQFEAAVEPMWTAILQGLKRLEQEGFFGRGADRSLITLMLVGDLPAQLVDAWVIELNPPDVATRYLNWNSNEPDASGKQ